MKKKRYVKYETNILKKVSRALVKMNSNIVAKPDKIIMEILSVLDIFRIKKITKIIYDIGEILECISSSIFIVIPKEPGTNECKLHQVVSLISHVIKIIRILINRAHSRIRLKIG